MSSYKHLTINELHRERADWLASRDNVDRQLSDLEMSGHPPHYAMNRSLQALYDLTVREISVLDGLLKERRAEDERLKALLGPKTLAQQVQALQRAGFTDFGRMPPGAGG